MKSEVDKLDIGKLWTSAVHLSKLSDAVKNEVVKKTIYDELDEKVNAIQTSNVSMLVKRADYNTTIAQIEKKIIDRDHGKYIATQEFNKLTADNVAAKRLAQVNLVTKADIADFVKETHNKLNNVNKKVISNETKHVLF